MIQDRFINIPDFETSVHREILSALVREADVIVDICADRAIAEMRCYLSRRYDCDRIFSARGEARHQLILMMALDIAVYHIFCLHNPQKLSQIRRDRYERAIEWLKAVAREDISIDGAPLLPEEDRSPASPFVIRSNPRRNSHM